MPLEKSSKQMFFIAIFAMFGASALFIAGGLASISGATASDSLIYIGATLFCASMVAAMIGIVFWSSGYAIVWATHFMCVADRRRASYIIAKGAAQQHVQQHVRY